MIPYHFTQAKFLPNIKKHVLLPGTDREKSEPLLTLCIPVVWLTRNDGSPEWMSNHQDDAVRLTVEPRKKRLVHWQTWMENATAEIDGQVVSGSAVLNTILECNSEYRDRFLECWPDFYVHFGRLPASRIRGLSHVEWDFGEAAA